MRRSFRSGVRPGSDEEIAGLAGWLYTDLMLGLVVVFLGASLITLPALDQPEPVPVDDTEEGSNVSTSTTTTLPPVALCRSLYSSPGAQVREDGLWVLMRTNSPVTEATRDEFLRLYQEQIDDEAANDPQSALAGRSASDTHIGLVIASGGARSNEDVGRALGEARAFVEGLQRLLPEIFSESDSYSAAIIRPGGTQTIQPGFVGMDIFPYVESPCSELP